MLIDRATIFVRSGKGGDGMVSFRREKYIPKGGPNGGDGGKGGDVILEGDPSLNTLLPLTPRPHYRARHGGPGESRSKHGADAPKLIIKVPLGTIVYDAEAGESPIADISEPGQQVMVARGGRGGFGNEHFKSATNQTPREATPGEPYEERTLRLELKLIADVGLVGKPNAGKSTLLRASSHATPKVADYPFTTLSPHLGMVILPGDRRLVMADLPGLIEGAAGGAGLGHDFLRHVERTRVLVHVLEVEPLDGTTPMMNYRSIRQELRDYSEALAAKPEIIAVNKVDLLPGDERPGKLDALISEIERETGRAPIFISAATGERVPELLEACDAALRTEAPRETPVSIGGWGRPDA